jgi:hypothetical protein
MPLSISNSDATGSDAVRATSWRWITTWLLALVVAALIVGAAEAHWRALGYLPNIRDSSELWSIQRDRVYVTKKTPLVLLGASRIEFAIDTKRLAELLPHFQPVMLAQNAHYPLATLRDLANDERFHGVVLCDVESGGLYKMYTDMQQPLVDYYHRQWSPSWHLHRLLLTAWQRRAVIADPDLGAVAVALRLLAGTSPPRPDYIALHADRSGDIDYTRTDPEAAKHHFEELLARGNELRALVAPDAWFADLQEVYEWTKRIETRGGKVIFYQSPTSGAVRDVDAVAHPHAVYWDRFVANSTAAVLDAASDPQLSAFALPDGSHLDFRDKAAYTSALVDALVSRKLLEP